MAALTVTAASVTQGSASQRSGILGETCTAGQAVYLKSSDQRLWLAQSDGTAAEAAAVGILLTGGSAGQLAIYAESGPMIIGATTAKVHYFVHTTAGGVGLAGDIGSGNYITRLGYATDATGTFVVDIRVEAITF